MVGDIKLFAGTFAPQGWAYCNGALMSIAQNQALFAVIGTTYGGNGETDFALPNLPGVENEGAPGGFKLFDRDPVINLYGKINAQPVLSNIS